MLSDNIKSETRDAHQALEKMIVQQIKAVRSSADYAMLLQLFYGYYYPLEQLLDHFLQDAIVPRYSIRRKANIILQDLQQVSASAGSVHLCQTIPAIDSTASALGVLYVLEGSTLGGVFIAQMLTRQAMVPASQLNFFNGYGENSMAHWQEFLQSINHYSEDAVTANVILQSALQTFECFRLWIPVFYAIPEIAGSSGRPLSSAR